MARHTMKNTNNKLAQVLDIEPIPLMQGTEVVAVNAVEDDTEFARQNIRNMIQKGNDAMENLIHIAKETEHPRAYEVVAGLLKTLADANKDLLELQKRKKDLEPKINNNTVNVDKAVFVGSTNDLVKLLKGNK